jgi:hypothetical protein
MQKYPLQNWENIKKKFTLITALPLDEVSECQLCESTPICRKITRVIKKKGNENEIGNLQLVKQAR